MYSSKLLLSSKSRLAGSAGSAGAAKRAAARCLALSLFFSPLACGRDFSLPSKPQVLEPEPELLGELAGTYHATVMRVAKAGTQELVVYVPVTSDAVIQHLAFPVLEADGQTTSQPIVMSLFQPEAANPLVSSEAGGSTSYLMSAFTEFGAIKDGQVFFPNGEPEGQLSAVMPAGGGLVALSFDACPGLEVFSAPAPLLLERECLFGPSRSGVFSGCETACGGKCDPSLQPYGAAVAMGFAPLGSSAFDLVVATTWWADKGAVWKQNLSYGVYDHFEQSGIALTHIFGEPNLRPTTFSMSRVGDAMTLDWRENIYQPIDPSNPKAGSTPPFVLDPPPSSLGAVVPAGECNEELHLQRLAGGGEERCLPRVASNGTTLHAALDDQRSDRLLIQVDVSGLGVLRDLPTLLQAPAAKTFVEATGLVFPTVAPARSLSDFVSVTARSKQGALSPCLVGDPRSTACFQYPAALAKEPIVVEAELKISGEWMACPGWPRTTNCDDTERTLQNLELPLQVALPLCFRG